MYIYVYSLCHSSPRIAHIGFCCAASIRSIYRSRIFVKVYERTSRVWDVKKEFEVQAQNEPLLAIVREKVSSPGVCRQCSLSVCIIVHKKTMELSIAGTGRWTQVVMYPLFSEPEELWNRIPVVGTLFSPPS